MHSHRSAMADRSRLPPREERERALAEAGYNLFELAAEDVYVDLLTDSGTGTMSKDQWAALVRGDEAYAGSPSFDRLEAAVEDVMGFSEVIPAHQGRGAENVLYGCLLSEADTVIANAHFDTTRAHVANQGADPVDCPTPESEDRRSDAPFKGNLDVETAREVAAEVGHDRVGAVLLTITNNSVAGQPVSVANTRAARALADEVDAPLVLDACRFAENAHFVSEREDEFADASVAEVAREQLSYADAVVMSGKKDGLVNAGGFVALADGHDDLATACRDRAILYEGFPTYGGMTGRTMEAFAVGLREAVEEAYVAARVGQVRDLGERLRDAGVPVVWPPGGHAVYVDAGECLPHVPADRFPGQALACELYLEGGVRGVELGSLAFPGTDRPELVRLALPRRTYHEEHLAHVVETARAVVDRAAGIGGYEIVDAPGRPELRHFSAELAPLANAGTDGTADD